MPSAEDGFADQSKYIRESLARQGMLHHLGVSIDEIAPRRVTLSLAFREEVAQQHGFFHGGAVGFLIDDATAAAAATVLRPGETLVSTTVHRFATLGGRHAAHLKPEPDVSLDRHIRIKRIGLENHGDVPVLRMNADD